MSIEPGTHAYADEQLKLKQRHKDNYCLLNKEGDSRRCVIALMATKALAVDRLSPNNYQALPVDIWSPVVSVVYCNLVDENEDLVDYSGDAYLLETAVSYDNQFGANDCCYWAEDIELVGDDVKWSGDTAHTPIGINSFT